MSDDDGAPAASSSGGASAQLKLDKKTEQGFVQFFRSLPQLEGTVKFFDRKGYYSLHGQDALLVAAEYYKTSATVKHLGLPPNQLPSVCVSQAMFANVARDLLTERNAKIEVWQQNGTGSTWSVAKRGSPGNLAGLEDVLYANADMGDAPVIMAAFLSVNGADKTVGVAYVDGSRHVIGVTEFPDNDLFSLLESTVVQVGAKECVLEATSSPDQAKIGAVMEKCGVAVTEVQKSRFVSSSALQDLGRLLTNARAADAAVNMPAALGCIGALLKYLDLLADESNLGRYTFRMFNNANYMRLDAAAVRALHLLPSLTEGNRRFSLYGLLNVCRTSMGSRLLRVWIRQPLMELAEIATRHNIVDALVQDTQMRHALYGEHMKGINDINALSRKFIKGRASLADVVTLYQNVLRLPAIRDALSMYKGAHASVIEQRYVAPLTQLVANFANFEAMVEATIDLSRVADHEYMINPKFDPELEELQGHKDSAQRKMGRVPDEVAADLGLEVAKVKLERNSQLGHFLRVSRKEESALRGKKAYVMLETRKDGVRFTNSRLRELSERYESLSQEYVQKQSALVQRALEIVATYLPVVDEMNELLAELDVLVSFAHVSVTATMPFVRPNMTEAGVGDVVIDQGRHPCMESLEGVQFVSNSAHMVRGESNFVIVTGPNMGGKSTYIRMIGMIVLMAQIGCFVPAARASICVCDSILARIGAGDAMLRGVSTFMAEMLETAAVLRTATPKSLVIIDELGRGTSTYDGFGLAWAISEHIASDIRCMCLFATHFHELTALAKHAPGVKNAHVAALTTATALTLLYQVRDGACDESFGIHVAEMAHFPRAVVEVARKKARELEQAAGTETFEPPPRKRVEVEC